jgi:hypothetical protein
LVCLEQEKSGNPDWHRGGGAQFQRRVMLVSSRTG